VNVSDDVRVTAQAGSAEPEAAIASLFTGHYTRLVRVATVLLSEPWTAEDVVQDAFVGLYRGWDRLRSPEAAAGYLHRSVVNAARSQLRRRVVARRYEPAAPPDEVSAEDTALARWRGGPLVAALRALPSREREVVLLRYYLDLSERQAADTLGISIGAVKAYGSRGLAALRNVLGPRLADLDEQEGKA
jgi:RNA polymerase sigma-70 factor (sigma-E family)